MFYTDNDNDALRLAKTEARFDAQVGMLQKIVQKKWGDDGVDQTLHALGLKSMRDIQSASIKDMGHRATVTFADGTPGPELVKTAKGWRLDLPAFARSLGMPVDDYLKQLRQISKVLPDVADAIVSGKLSQPSDVVQDVVKRLNAVAP
jgi:CHAD domain-containing protein